MKSPLEWQTPAKRMLIALVPAAAGAVWFFGWRALVVLLVVNAAGFLTEYLFTRFTRSPVTSDVFVISSLFALSLPPALPYWIAVVGVVFGVLFAKLAFGGAGKTVFHPAMVGRVFIYVCFPAPMNARWVQPLTATGPLDLPSSWGGFARFAADATSGATPLAALEQARPVSVLSLLWGNVAGSLGETSAILLLAGALFLAASGSIKRRTALSAVVSFLAVQAVLWAAGAGRAADPLSGLLAGSALMGFLFVAADPGNAARTSAGLWISGALVGSLTALIRTFSAWPEGTMFAVLLANTFTPLVDFTARSRRSAADRPVEGGPGAEGTGGAPRGTAGGT